MSKSFILKGNICYSERADQIEIRENSYLVCENGISGGIYQQFPKGFRNLEILDCGDRLIIPGLTDLHIHAPQYSFRGLNMDLELLDWLNTNTFPEEAKYADLSYAQKAYTIFADNLKRSATSRACIFATIHKEATMLLMDLMEQTGLQTFVGKVNMDRNSPQQLIEKNAGSSVNDTREWLLAIKDRYQNVRPILTPRFIPSCTDQLMTQLGVLQHETGLPLQSHLSENPSEVEWVKELCPESDFYGDAYDRLGVFGGYGQTIMAHCVYSDRREQQRIKERGVFIAHCPGSNMNLSSGIAPVREFLECGISVGLGTDVAGGFSDSVFRAMAEAIQVSKMRWRLVDRSRKPLTIDEAFYLGTKGGGSFFGKAGSFEEGYQFDALVLDDHRLKAPGEFSVRERLERLIYLAEDVQIQKKYVAGAELF